ncbi:MAG: helix-turn-helix domain-containing protein [Polyangiaceae bacterium]|nr:helix-turn-helix domain-containing protein [Polyangiaceae bacterium]
MIASLGGELQDRARVAAAEQVRRACDLRAEGKSTRDIARSLKINRSTVWRALGRAALQKGGRKHAPAERTNAAGTTTASVGVR